MRQLATRLKNSQFINFLIYLEFTIIFIISLLTMIGFGEKLKVNLIFGEFIGFFCFISLYPVMPKLEKTNIAKRAIVICTVIIICTFSGIFTASIATGKSLSLLIQDRPIRLLHVIILTISSGFIFRYFQKISQNAKIEKLKRLSLEKEALQTEYKILQAQIEPHFLFNTLSNILSLMDTSPDASKGMLIDFIFYLRNSLTSSRKSVTTIAEEIKTIRAYLNIFKIRFKNRLNFNINCDEKVTSSNIIPMIIQPVVENSLIHGIEPSIKGGCIDIDIKSVEKRLIISISDTGVGTDKNLTLEGFGLSNIRNRIKSYYGRDALIKFETNSPTGLKTTIEVPYADRSVSYSSRR